LNYQQIISLATFYSKRLIIKNNTSENELIPILKQQIQQVIHLMRSKKIQKLPLYLIIGAKDSGKTQLLKQNKLTFLHKIPNSLAELHQNECQWSIYRESIFIEIPEVLLRNSVDKKNNAWQKIIKLLNKYYQSIPLKALLITQDIDQLMKSSEESRQFNYHLCRRRLKEYYQITKSRLPVYIILTKCDNIPGFSAYFQALNSSDTNTSIGITTEEYAKNPSTIPLKNFFEQKFNDFVEALNQNLIANLHHEWNENLRLKMAGFPHQFDNLRVLLTGMIYHIAEKVVLHDAIAFQGLFLTSAKQGDNHIENLDNDISSTKALTTYELTNLSQTHFISGLFQRIIQLKAEQKSTASLSLRLTNASIIGVAIIASSALAYRLTHDLITLNSAQMQIFRYAYVPNPSLDSLNKAVNLVDKAKAFWLFSLADEYKQKNKIVATKTQTVKNANHNQAKITQKNNLLGLLNSRNLTPLQAYNGLKFYLMLHGKIKLQANYLTNFVAWSKTKNLNLSNNASKNIAASAYDAKLVQRLQNYLTQLPRPQLAYLALQSNSLDLLAKQITLPLNKQKVITVPQFYSANGVLILFANRYQQAIQVGIQGNDVIGKLAKTDSQEVIKGLFVDYLTDYRDWWQLQLNKVFTSNLNNVATLQKYLQSLQVKNLQTLLQSISINLNFQVLLANKILTAHKTDKTLFNSQVTHLMASLQRWQTINKNQSMQVITQILTQLKQQFLPVKLANSTNKNAYLMLLEEIKKPQLFQLSTLLTKNNTIIPYELNSWLKQLLQQSQSFVKQNAIAYLNQQWQQQVFITYTKTIANRYPIATDAKQNINLNDFKRFFAADGTMMSFFNQYILPLVDANQADWQWKMIAGQSIGLSKATLLMFERAKIISTMFFSQNNNQLAVQFTLQQQALMPIVKVFKLNINGQTLEDPRGTRNINQFVWPGNTQVNYASMSFINVNGEVLQNQFSGPWALFRLLSHADLKATKVPGKFTLKFNIDGTAARYQLTTPNPINPFLTGILNHFYCE
ncbi:MAG: type VI secretion system membrane subunit TssM, partial [Pseudomonadota bacterium]